MSWQNADLNHMYIIRTHSKAYRLSCLNTGTKLLWRSKGREGESHTWIFHKAQMQKLSYLPTALGPKFVGDSYWFHFSVKPEI